MNTEQTFVDIQRQNKQLNRLLEVSLVLNSNLEIDRLLEFILASTCEITACQNASILLYNRNTDELHFVALSSSSQKRQLARIPVPMEGSIAGEIVRENHPILINDPSDPRIYRGVDESINFVTRTLLGVPMSIKSDIIGVLEAVNKVNDAPWTNDDIDHLSILAAQAAVAIQNAQQSEQLKKAYLDLSHADKLKSDFIAIASHELRTPLGIILGYASFLKEESKGKASEHASAVMNSALQMRDLIEGLTQLRYLNIGQLELFREPTSVAELLETTFHDVNAMADAKGHTVNLETDDGSTMVFVDRHKIGMALMNLANNAVKFTPEQGTINLRMERRGHEVWISVQDTGPGIAKHQLEDIFKEFRQLEDHMTRQHNGMGIGLALARGMVQAHNGRIWAESDGESLGSTFFIVLPLDSAEDSTE